MMSAAFIDFSLSLCMRSPRAKAMRSSSVFDEEVPLEFGLAHRRAEPLVGDVERAPGVAVRQQRGRAGDLDDDRIGEQRAAGGAPRRRGRAGDRGCRASAAGAGRCAEYAASASTMGRADAAASSPIQNSKRSPRMTSSRCPGASSARNRRNRAIVRGRSAARCRSEMKSGSSSGAAVGETARTGGGSARLTRRSRRARSARRTRARPGACPGGPVRTALILSTMSKPSVTLPKTQ